MKCVYDEFQKLPVASVSAEFKAVHLSGSKANYLARNAEGAPVFLIAVPKDEAYVPSVRYKNLSVDYQLDCRVDSGQASFEGRFVALSCDSAAAELYEMFVRVVAVGVAQFSSAATARDVDVFVGELQRLFREFDAPGAKEAAGLWGELFVISIAHDCRTALLAWRSDNFERFDFYCKAGALEVKSTELTSRVHEFSLEQLEVPTARRGYIASLMLRPVSNGVGIMDLALRIEAHVQGEVALRDRLWRNVLVSMGADFAKCLDRLFDEHYAMRHLAVIPMHEVPAPARPLDRRISNIRFRCDLSTVVASSPVEAKTVLDAFF